MPIFRRRRQRNRQPPAPVMPLGAETPLASGFIPPEAPAPRFPRRSPAGSSLHRSLRGDSATELGGGINSEREGPPPAQLSPAQPGQLQPLPQGMPRPAPRKARLHPASSPPARGQPKQRLENRGVPVVLWRNDRGWRLIEKILEYCSGWILN